MCSDSDMLKLYYLDTVWEVIYDLEYESGVPFGLLIQIAGY